MSEHSPTPWKITEHDNGGLALRLVIRTTDSSGRPIASMWLNGDRPQANAAFIVKATNHFADLVECVRASLNMVNGDGVPPDWDFLRRTLKSAEASGGQS